MSITFNIRMVSKNDLPALQELYLNLYDTEIKPLTAEVLKLWEGILKDPNYYILIGEDKGEVVSSVMLVIIKKLTSTMQPYALIENIVTAPSHRNRGYAGLLLQRAVEIAREQNCYKVILMSNSTNESTLRLYTKAGFSDREKTAFVKRL